MEVSIGREGSQNPLPSSKVKDPQAGKSPPSTTHTCLVRPRPILLEEWHTLLGPTNGRFMTRATVILREIKVKYRSTYEGVGVHIWYETALEDYCERMRDEFPFLSPSSRDDILARVLVPSSDLSALEDGADEPLIYSSPFDPSATSYQTIVHAEQALQDYWQHPRTPSVWEHLIYYRRSFEKDTSIGRKDPEYTDFGEYLDFCESGLPPAVDQSTSFPTSEELDMISTLGKQWSLLSRKTPFLPYQSNMTDQEAEAAREHTTSAHLAPRVRSCAHEFSNAKAAALNQAFLRACENGEVEWAKRLFQRGASIYSADGSGEKASFKAVRGGSLPLFRFLALQGADLQEVNTDGDTILHIAAQYGRIPILDWMWQQQGAPNFHTQNKDGDTPLHAASQRGQLEAVQWIDMALADSDHSKNVSNNDGDTPLHKAAEHGHLPVVQWLCEQGGVAAHKMNDMMATPLDLAVWSGHDVVADWLQNH